MPIEVGRLISQLRGEESDYADDESDDLMQEKIDRKTFFHISLQDHAEMPCHYLVPLASQQPTDALEPRVGVAKRRGHGAGQTWYFPPDDDEEQTTKQLQSRIDFDPGFEWPFAFSAKMIPVNYSECMSVHGLGPERRESYVSYCDIVLQQRCKETVHVGPGFSPQSYKSSIIVYKDSTRKKFKNTVNYVTRMKPKRYEETNYIQGRRMDRTFVSFLDYDQNKKQNWFTTSVDLVPKTWSHNHVHNFEFRERADSLGSECDEMTELHGSTSEDEGIYNGDVHMCFHSPDQVQRLKLMNGDIDMTMVSSSHRNGLVTPEDSSDSDTLSYRAKLVINANRPPSYCGDDFVSNGYASDDVEL